MSDASTSHYDVVNAGGGPTGLAAALMLGRVRRRVLVCDTARGRNATVAKSHGYFTRDGVSPDELLRTGRPLAPGQALFRPSVTRARNLLSDLDE